MENSEIILDNLYCRKSVREFTDRKVDKEDLLKIVRAGMSAPSAMNLQPWELIVFDDEDTLDFMVNLHDYSKMFKTAPAGIVVCGNMNKTINNLEDFWLQDCSACTENILLAIEALNMGAVWLGIYPIKERCEKLSDYFNLPENIVPFSVIALGFPVKEFDAQDKWDEKKVHWNMW